MKKILTLLVLMASAIAPIMAEKIQPSVTLPENGRPEHVYNMTSGNGLTSNALTAPTASADKYGQFAFYAVNGVNGAYYIYSRTANK